MDLNLTPREQEFRDEVRAWLSANVPKDWTKIRNAEQSMEARFAYLRAWQRKLFDAGWAGISWPKDYGGRGASLMEQVIFNEEMARAEAASHGACARARIIGPTIIAFGTEEQKKRISKRFCAATRSGARVFQSPTRARTLPTYPPKPTFEGDHYIVNGQKCGPVLAGWPIGASCWCAPTRP